MGGYTAILNALYFLFNLLILEIMIPHSFNFDDNFASNVKTYSELSQYIERHDKDKKIIVLIDKSIWDFEDGLWIRRY